MYKHSTKQTHKSNIPR